jgi:hypothetical protein
MDFTTPPSPPQSPPADPQSSKDEFYEPGSWQHKRTCSAFKKYGSRQQIA